jgi:LDH2 family malate/lactate/ureidoglycolate dehydrogenase
MPDEVRDEVKSEVKSDDVIVASDTLRALMQDIFTATGVPDEQRAIVVDTLMEASLCGYDSHGVMRIPMFYKGTRDGHIDPRAELEIVQETPASALIDAHRAFGPVAATRAMELAGDKARESGIGCVSVTGSCDVARLGGYVVPPTRRGLIGLIAVNDGGGGPATAPWGGVDAFMSTNPLAAGIPRESAEPIVIDMSTSVVALGKLYMKSAAGEPAPPGWIIGEDGKTTTDVDALLGDPQRGALLPLGGIEAGHKGFGLSLLVDILCGALSGGGCSTGKKWEIDVNGIFALAIDPERFSSASVFGDIASRFVDGVKGSRRAPGVDEILVPGERSFRERERRLRDGIPVYRKTLTVIEEILDELELPRQYGF